MKERGGCSRLQCEEKGVVIVGYSVKEGGWLETVEYCAFVVYLPKSPCLTFAAYVSCDMCVSCVSVTCDVTCIHATCMRVRVCDRYTHCNRRVA